MQPDLLLTFDVGTTAIKTILWDAGIAPLGIHRQEYRLQTSGRRIEVDPQVYIDAVVAGARSVLGSREAARVAAICLTTQGETLIPLGADGTPAGNAIVWLDARAEAQAERLTAVIPVEEFHRRTGLPAIDGSTPLAKAMGVLEGHRDDRGPVTLLLVEDFLVHWLTGRVVGNRSLHTSTGWLDRASGEYWAEALTASGVDTGHLPALVDSGEPIGGLLPHASCALGLRPDVPVIAGAMDQAAAALGAGLTRSGVVGVSFGTALVVTAPLPPDFADPLRRATVYRAAVGGEGLGVLFEPTSGALLRWLRDLLSRDDAGSPSYAELDALAARVPIGSEGVLALPSFESGTAGRGAFLGLSLNSGRGHLTRSLLEATSFALADLLDTLAELGIPATELRTSGGGSASRLWQTIVAEVCNVPVTPLPFTESASAGAALLAAWGAGLHEPGHDPRRLAEIQPFAPAHPERYLEPRARFRRAREVLEGFWTPAVEPDPRRTP